MNGTVTISGGAVEVLALLDSLEVTLADDDDENFTGLIDGKVLDSVAGGVQRPTSIPLASAILSECRLWLMSQLWMWA